MPRDVRAELLGDFHPEVDEQLFTVPPIDTETLSLSRQEKEEISTSLTTVPALQNRAQQAIGVIDSIIKKYRWNVSEDGTGIKVVDLFSNHTGTIQNLLVGSQGTLRQATIAFIQLASYLSTLDQDETLRNDKMVSNFARNVLSDVSNNMECGPGIANKLSVAADFLSMCKSSTFLGQSYQIRLELLKIWSAELLGKHQVVRELGLVVAQAYEVHNRAAIHNVIAKYGQDVAFVSPVWDSLARRPESFSQQERDTILDFFKSKKRGQSIAYEFTNRMTGRSREILEMSIPQEVRNCNEIYRWLHEPKGTLESLVGKDRLEPIKLHIGAELGRRLLYSLVPKFEEMDAEESRNKMEVLYDSEHPDHLSTVDALIPGFSSMQKEKKEEVMGEITGAIDLIERSGDKGCTLNDMLEASIIEAMTVDGLVKGLIREANGLRMVSLEDRLLIGSMKGDKGVWYSHPLLKFEALQYIAEYDPDILRKVKDALKEDDVGRVESALKEIVDVIGKEIFEALTSSDAIELYKLGVLPQALIGLEHDQINLLTSKTVREGLKDTILAQGLSSRACEALVSKDAIELYKLGMKPKELVGIGPDLMKLMLSEHIKELRVKWPESFEEFKKVLRGAQILSQERVEILLSSDAIESYKLGVKLNELVVVQPDLMKLLISEPVRELRVKCPESFEEFKKLVYGPNDLAEEVREALVSRDAIELYKLGMKPKELVGIGPDLIKLMLSEHIMELRVKWPESFEEFKKVLRGAQILSQEQAKILLSSDAIESYKLGVKLKELVVVQPDLMKLLISEPVRELRAKCPESFEEFKKLVYRANHLAEEVRETLLSKDAIELYKLGVSPGQLTDVDRNRFQDMSTILQSESVRELYQMDKKVFDKFVDILAKRHLSMAKLDELISKDAMELYKLGMFPEELVDVSKDVMELYKLRIFPEELQGIDPNRLQGLSTILQSKSVRELYQMDQEIFGNFTYVLLNQNLSEVVANEFISEDAVGLYKSGVWPAELGELCKRLSEAGQKIEGMGKALGGMSIAQVSLLTESYKACTPYGLTRLCSPCELSKLSMWSQDSVEILRKSMTGNDGKLLGRDDFCRNMFICFSYMVPEISSLNVEERGKIKESISSLYLKVSREGLRDMDASIIGRHTERVVSSIGTRRLSGVCRDSGVNQSVSNALQRIENTVANVSSSRMR
ncbi:hypothetical protein EDM53_05780 [Rickettsiales endosymbiont of Peranema trichophorum]|uniref:hypothetical protein n=1 Tax=Rickettsiales endosymbiont of Peranema trichophorum TaxID=2486577 RepID=UPI0010233201|nr:hypothetical protein [Rickettsiales endosymbiont of Peranema trichophorum]RZI45170.1 hypothetical protein EDM53_05780 [Rickettsiales endosymbiont of Peranema trichophorum]